MEEVWKNIPGFEGYQVSNKGNVRTFNKVTYTKKHGVRHWKDRLLKPRWDYKTKNQSVQLWKDGKHKSYLVHRIEAFTFYGGDFTTSKLTVNHIDGDRTNNNLENLEIITLKENIQHAFRNSLYDSQTKIKIEDKITGSIFFPSSLSEGCKFLNKNHGYLSSKIQQKIYENEKYRWELL